MRILSKDLLLPSFFEKYIGISNKRAKIKKWLIQRENDPWEVLLSWRNIPLDLSLVAYVSNTIKETAFWPNSLYVPGDELSVLTADYTGTFTEIHLCNEFERHFKKSVDLDDFQMSYLDFLKKYIADCSSDCPKTFHGVDQSHGNKGADGKNCGSQPTGSVYERENGFTGRFGGDA